MKLDIVLKKKARIEMLPLIDIVFLLLVFFIYAMLSMSVHRSLPVALPESATAELDTGKSISLTITPGENTHEYTLSLNKDTVTLSALTERLKARAEKNTQETGKKTGVMLFAGKEVDYQTLFKVLDQVRLAGITDVSLQAAAIE
ncbi:MAG: biopolymer transporter ExbD [Desulfobulbaceae bacterium]|nr:biopolymer transporter ExbD [Desulfobulbaceae bacterium]